MPVSSYGNISNVRLYQNIETSVFWVNGSTLHHQFCSYIVKTVWKYQYLPLLQRSMRERFLCIFVLEVHADSLLVTMWLRTLLVWFCFLDLLYVRKMRVLSFTTSTVKPEIRFLVHLRRPGTYDLHTTILP